MTSAAHTIVTDLHPVHTRLVTLAGPERFLIGFGVVDLPPETRGRKGRRLRRACRKEGGHYWHPANAMIEWGCCNCGARRDGNPKDGT